MTEILVLALGLILTAGMLEKLYVHKGKVRRFFGFTFRDVHEAQECWRYWTFCSVSMFRVSIHGRSTKNCCSPLCSGKVDPTYTLTYVLHNDRGYHFSVYYQ